MNMKVNLDYIFVNYHWSNADWNLVSMVVSDAFDWCVIHQQVLFTLVGIVIIMLSLGMLVVNSLNTGHKNEDDSEYIGSVEIDEDGKKDDKQR